jgi:hypothetical protein
MAVLIQAKQSDTASTHLTTYSEKEQFDLLSGRPSFDVDARSAPAAVGLMAYEPDNALMYGLTPPDATPAMPSNLSIIGGIPPITFVVSHQNSTFQQRHVSPRVLSNSCRACEVGTSISLRQRRTGPISSSGAAEDDWPALINYLLVVTFFKPLKQLKNPAGSPPDRGLNEPLYLIGRAPSGVSIFAVMDYDGPGSHSSGTKLESIYNPGWRS